MVHMCQLPSAPRQEEDQGYMGQVSGGGGGGGGGGGEVSRRLV